MKERKLGCTCVCVFRMLKVTLEYRKTEIKLGFCHFPPKKMEQIVPRQKFYFSGDGWNKKRTNLEQKTGRVTTPVAVLLQFQMVCLS